MRVFPQRSRTGADIRGVDLAHDQFDSLARQLRSVTQAVRDSVFLVDSAVHRDSTEGPQVRESLTSPGRWYGWTSEPPDSPPPQQS